MLDQRVLIKGCCNERTHDIMSDFENTVDDLKGKAKETIGEATGNESLADEGKADQVIAGVKDAVHNAGESIKEAAENAGESIKDAANKLIGSFKKDDDA